MSVNVGNILVYLDNDRMIGVQLDFHQKRVRLPGAESEAGRPRQDDGFGVWREYQIAVASKLPRPFDS